MNWPKPLAAKDLAVLGRSPTVTADDVVLDALVGLHSFCMHSKTNAVPACAASSKSLVTWAGSQILTLVSQEPDV